MNTPSISGHTSLVGLIGWPLGHTLSPVMHNAAFAELSLDWIYLPMPVRLGEVDQALRGMVALNFSGCNVTVPHKGAIIATLDEASQEAQIIGAVNTVHIQDGIVIGANTDVAGFLSSLQESGCQPQGMRALVLGAGGAARAIVYALARAQVDSISIYNRTLDRAARLASDMAGHFPNCMVNHLPFTEDVLANLDGRVDLVINTTSLGMAPWIDTCPWPDIVPMPTNATYIDLVYNPLETLFLARARETGAVVLNGLGMLVHQGALAFEVWTGRAAPVEVMRQACLNALGK